MFSRKKPEPKKRRNHDLSQFGLTEIPDDFDPTGGAIGDDSDLEAELSAIVGGGGKKKPQVKPKATLMPTSELDKMIADSMRDIGSDEELSGDEDDPELLGELQGIAGVELESEPISAVEEKESTEEQQLFLPTTTTDTISIIKSRIEMYTLAEKGAKASGESAKARRYNRGLKTLNDLLKQSTAGKTINVDDIPPEVSVKGAKPAEEPSPDAIESPKTPSRTAPAVPTRTAPVPPPVQKAASVEEKPEEPKSDNPILLKLNERKQEYKIAAITAKRSGDTAMALQFVKVLKQFDMVIKLCEEGKEVDLSDMPPPPNEFADFLAKMQAGANEPAKVEEPAPPPAAVPEESTETPTNMLEALEQRLLKYKSVEEAAKAENNSSKARRFGRIVKQYEDAIKSYKAGRPVAYDELPTPPGFGPLPGTSDEQKPAAPEAVPSVKPTPPPKPATAPIAEPDQDTSAESTPKPAHRSPKQELTTRMSGNQHSTNLAEQQMKILLDRQKEFKIAAIEAKKAGEIEQAKEYLKIYKGFEGLLNAASSGLPVDLSTLPVPPSQRDNLEASFAIVSEGDCDPNDDISDISVRLEEQLAKQLMMCKNTRDHHKAMGDIAGMNRFENLALTVQKDLDLIRYSKRKNFPLPKFHYEQKSFNIVHCNTDLTDNEVEIMIIRGINYNVSNPKDVDSYVKVEFPYPQEDFFKAKSSLVRDTDSPDYNQRFKVDIQRSNRQCQRLFKRQAVKFEVYSRGGFLRSDTLIGTVNLKLQPLETKCEIHDTYDLMDGRKAVGGKLEIKVRVRNPILTKQIEHVNEKWLVLDT